MSSNNSWMTPNVQIAEKLQPKDALDARTSGTAAESVN